MMDKVFIVNNSGHDYSDAKRFGELIIMSEGVIDKFNVTSMLRTFKKHLNTSTKNDFILQSGPSIMNAVACAEFATNHSCLNLLIWRYEQDGRSDRYTHHRLNLGKVRKDDRD